jgi:hypothetical protein
MPDPFGIAGNSRDVQGEGFFSAGWAPLRTRRNL